MAAGDLERSLGLFPTMMISMGAMIGSGIFVLPALGFKKAGPAVILAYVLAAAIVMPAALSKSEMATAMPESGGTYLYIDRALGPLFGTIAGIGAWFSLVFKSSFALVGLGAYFLLFAPVSQGAVVFVALGLAVLVVALNVSGTKLSGSVQAVIVSLVLVGLVAYTLNAGFVGDTGQFTPFTPEGNIDIVTAAAFVFVSYAGVTKIASVAEEVKDPGRNLPLAMLGSLSVMLVIYVAVGHRRQRRRPVRPPLREGLGVGQRHHRRNDGDVDDEHHRQRPEHRKREVPARVLDLLGDARDLRHAGVGDEHECRRGHDVDVAFGGERRELARVSDEPRVERVGHQTDRKSTRLNSSHRSLSRMPSSA